MGKLGAALLVILAMVTGVTTVARAETTDCTPIASLPFTITVQDSYCLTADLSTATTPGAAIDIQTNNVVVDLNGFVLDGSGAGAGTQAIGIHALNRQNITIRNGTIRGFLAGIFLENSGASMGHLVEGINADQNTHVGIQVEGSGVLARKNRVSRTGTTAAGPDADAIGILAAGAGPRVVDNDVTDTTKQGTGTAVGIQFKATTVGGLAEDNRVTTADTGIEFLAGATGKCRGTLLFSVTTPFVGCTDATNNNPPVITEGASIGVTMDEDGTPTAFSLTLNATDPDVGNILTWSISTPAGNGLATASGPGTSKAIGYAPNANYNGADSFVVQVSDGNGGIDTITVNVTINAINDAPSFTLAGNPAAVDEDAGAQSVLNFATSISAGPANESAQTLTFIVQNNSNPGLFTGGAAPAIDATTGTLTYTAGPDLNGTAVITVVLQDSGSGTAPNVNTSPSQQFTITVNAVNDPPSFTLAGNPPAVDEDSGLQTIVGFASSISKGPADEAGQTLTFLVQNNTNAGLFTGGSAPAISSIGTLTYQSGPNLNGTATITVFLQDSGSNTPPNSNASPTQQFTITINSVNDAPTNVTDKSFTTVVGNVSITTAAGTLLAGATDVENNTPFTAKHPTAVNAPTTTTQLGNVTVNSDGSYFYNPPAGYEGPDSFTFQVCDSLGACSTPANTVNLTVTGMIWFINNTIGTPCLLRANGCGRLSSPYTTLAAFNAENNGTLTTSLNPAINDSIFIYESNTAYVGPLTLLNNQKLIGQDATNTLSDITSLTPPAQSPALPAMNTGAPAVTITSSTNGVVLNSGTTGNTLRGFTLGDVTSTGTALSGTSFGTLTLANGTTQTADLTINTNGAALNLTTGTIASVFAGITSTGGTNNISLTGVATSTTTNLGSGTLSGATGASFNVSGGTGSFTYSGNITQSNAAALVNLTGNHTTGTITLSGTLTASGSSTGLQFSNADGTYNFTGTTALSGAAGINIASGSGGTFSFNANTSISNPSGVGFNVDGSGTAVTGGITYNGTISKTSAGRLIDFENYDTGTASFTGALSCSSSCQGIEVQNSSGAVTFSNATKTLTTANTGATPAVNLVSNAGTISFTNGGLAITTTSATGFNATGGGTVNVTGSSNTINSGSGTALNVSSTTIGASNLNFQSISSSGGSATGIILDTTGASGGLIVNGDGSNTTKGGNSTGGTISGKSGADGSTTTGIGIYLNSTSNVVLRRMTINGTNQNYGIRGLTVNNFTLEYSTVGGTNGTSDTLDEGTVSFGSRTGANGLTGTGTITKSVFSGGFEDNFSIFNSSGTLSITMDDISSSGAGNDGVVIQARTSATVTADIKNSEFSANHGDHFNGTGDDSANVTFNFGNNGANTLTGGGVGSLGQSITIQTGVAWAGTGSANVANNSINGAIDTPININIGGTGTFSAKVDGNTIGTSGVANSGTTGSKDAIRIVANGDGSVDATPDGGTFTAAVRNNTIQQVSGNGIFVIARDGGTVADPILLNITITGNTLKEPNPGANGIRLESCATSTDHATLHADIGGAGAAANDIQGDWGVVAGADEIRLRHQFSALCRFILRDLGANQSTGGPVATYLAGRNTTFPPATASATILGGGVYETGGTPPLP